MNPPADQRWRRDVFQPRLAHLPDPDRPVVRTRSGRRQQALCLRYVRVDEPAKSDPLRCPDCAKLDTEDHDEGHDESGGAAGPPAASLS